MDSTDYTSASFPAVFYLKIMRNLKLTLPRQFILLTLIVGFCLMLFACPVKELDKNRPEKELADFYSRLPIEMPRYETLKKYRTPKGVYVVTQDAVPDEHQEMQFKAVDAAADRALLESASLGWTKARSHNDIVVAMIRPTYTQTEGLNAGAGNLTMRSGDTVAGTVVTLRTNPKDKNVVMHVPVIPQNWDKPQATKEFLRNELQHYLTMLNNWEMHLRHAQRGNDVHPLPEFTLPDENDWLIAPIEADGQVSLLKSILRF